MIIDRSGFFVIAAALATGGIGGWLARDSGVALRPTPPPAVVVVPLETALPESLTVFAAKSEAPAPPCDDNIGVAEECPTMGPADEAVCANVIAKRCADYKAAFKPKVAQDAVSCLRQLKGNERCDPARVNLCGHAALMAACPEPVVPAKGSYVKATATTPASFKLDADANATPSPVTTACDNLATTCTGQNVTDCRQTLAGMNENGRNSTLECTAAHCRDRGLLGCEAVRDIFVQGQAQR